MFTRKIQFLLALLIALSTIAILGLGSVSAQTAATPTSTATKLPATATPTATTVKAAATATATATKVPATATSTATKAAATATSTATKPAATATSTATKPAATATSTATKAAATATKTVTPAPTATAVRAAPRAGAGILTTLTTAFVVQNAGTGPTDIWATFTYTDGSPYNTLTRTSVGAGSNTIFDQRETNSGSPIYGGLGATWNGAVVVSSTMPMAALVMEYGGGSSSGGDFRFDVYPGYSTDSAATSFNMPQVLKNFASLTSVIYVQNTTNLSATLTVSYTNNAISPAGFSVHPNIQVAPNGYAVIDMANEVSQWSTFSGPVKLTSDQKVAVIVNRSKPGVLISYRGLTPSDAGTTLIIPQALKDLSTLLWYSAIEGMTVDGGSSTYSVTYKNILNGQQNTCSLPSGNTFHIDFRSPPPTCSPILYGTAFQGQVVIVGSRSLVAMVNQGTMNQAMGYRVLTTAAFPSTGGTTSAYAPLIMNAYTDLCTSGCTGTNWGTAIEGRMAGTGTVQVQYYLSSGTVYTDTYTVGSDQVFRFDQRSQNPQTHFSLPLNVKGAAVVTGPYPLIFKLNYSADANFQGDGAGALWGINQ